jgi:hypothetical protein
MRKVALGGLLLVAALLGGTSTAQASDQSIRDVVITHGQRQVGEDQRFLKAMRKLETNAQKRKARKAAGRQGASVKMWRNALAPEVPDTEPIAAAKQNMLEGLNLYLKGLRRLNQALDLAIRKGGNAGVKTARRALKNMRSASKKVGQAAEIIVG